MSWQGANIARRRRASKQEGRPNEETVEAALNRLSKAYNTAMTCVGAWNKVSHLEDVDIAKLRQVGRAARRAFEEALLTDPLISEKHAPLLNQTLEKHSMKAPAVELRSGGHKNTVERLAYLSLVNYADLLLAGCGRKENSPTNVNRTILDRGVVKPLKNFTSDTAWAEIHHDAIMGIAAENEPRETLTETSRSGVGEGEFLNKCTTTNDSDPMDISIDNGDHSLQISPEPSTLAINEHEVPSKSQSSPTEVEEPEKVTVRLALVAYIDATSIDCTDPTVWLKLACSARRLGRLLESRRTSGANSSDQTAFLSYRHLEKYALEQALTSLPVGIPPNRMVQRALEEWEKEEEENVSSGYVVDVRVKHDPVRVFDFPVLRYSWSHVGRMLLRLCSEGLQQKSSEVQYSPNIKLKLSPLLAMPFGILGEICLYLQPADIYRFEATCHALSSAIVAARAALDHKAVRRESLPSSQAQKGSAVPSGKTQVASSSIEKNAEEKAPASRASKRVRSQIITSGKRTERENRRSSTKFCLLSATLGCTEDSDEYQAAVKTGHASLVANSRATGQGDASSNGIFKKQGRVKLPLPSSDYSLYDFIRVSAEQPQTTLDTLCDFVSKVAMNVADVFQSDHNSYMLTSIMLECFEVISEITNNGDGRTTCWSSAPAGQFSKLGQLGLFAVDLLDAELSLLKCEQDGYAHDVKFGGYRSVVVSKAPYLMSMIPIIESKLETECRRSNAWVNLKCRCFWLNAGLYLWQGRSSQNVTDSREAENFGLQALQEAMDCLKEFPLDPVITPHLVSPSRKSQVWKELTLSGLSSFKNDVQASSILLQTEESFLKIITDMNGMGSDDLLATEQLASLDSIGSKLLSRYAHTDGTGPGKHAELVSDLLNENGTEMLSPAIWDDSVQGHEQDEWFQKVAPVFHIETVRYFLDLRRPCLLTILLSCIQTKAGRQIDVLNLLFSLCNSVTALWEELQSQITDRSEEISFKKVECDSDDESLDDYQERTLAGENESKKSRLRQYSALYRLLVGRIALLCETEPTDILDYGALNKIVCAGLRQTVVWSQVFDLKDARDGDFLEDIRLFRAIQHLKRTMKEKLQERCEAKKVLEKVYISGIIEVICQQRTILDKIMAADCDRNQRLLRSKIIRRRCELLESACCDFGLILSENTVTIADQHIVRSALLSGSNSDGTLSSIATLCESLMWMWGAASGTSIDNQSTAERLKVSTACALVGICGSASSTMRVYKSSSEGERTIRLDEFYDSDSSTAHWLADLDAETDIERSKSVNLLRVLNQAVHCIANVFNSVDEKETAAFVYSWEDRSKNCPVLPVIVVRVLNNFADLLLQHFAEEGKHPSVWSQYPAGVKSTGQLLDSLLHKAYKSLYGFTLVHDNKDAPSGSVSVNEKSRHSLPESPSAAAALYRCILRTYSQGRRSPPKSALEAILSVLPPSAETAKASDIRKFLFSKDGPWMTAKEWRDFVKQSDGWDAYFSGIEEWIVRNTSVEETYMDDEMTIVRRGASNLLAQSNISSNCEAGADEDCRLVAVQLEEENARKFFAIIDSLCLGHTSDVESWFAAAQCVIVKAETIADRLGLSTGFGRNSNFSPSATTYDQERKIPFGRLLEEQHRENSLVEQGWVQCLGKDLSVYVTYTWSSLDSLKHLSEAVLSGYRDEFIESKDSDEAPPFDLHIWNEIEQLRLKTDHSTWQQAWGGLFVSALRNIASRCAQIAVYILHKNRANDDLRIVQSEIMESMGIFFYTDLMASQLYGYPMRLLTPYSKRQIAEASLACFERSVETASLNDEILRTSWDLKLMIGKCHEKIANTYWGEEFSTDGQITRKYEYHLSKALEAYNSSIVEARNLESSNELIVEGSGGSSHGSAEPLYRLHASRLKCLVRAVNLSQGLRNFAELEALRITECFWYTKEPDLQDTQLDVRDRVWYVLVDIVTAMAQFRHDFPYFHRSVYRHAQALLWAPVFHNPTGQRSNGSLGTVPAVKASQLRGLNYATDAACSGVVVISSLFDKKRQQLCAVWVTRDSSESAFSALNSSIRKYDSLRGKYASAYIESLSLCDRRAELETFLKWVYSCKRDLPSYFSVTASHDAVDSKPKKSHSNDCLLIKPRVLSSRHFLTTIKRETNRALAMTILSELKKPLVGGDAKDNLLQLAYACYLRLNCQMDDLAKVSSWRYKKSGAKEAIQALMTAHLRFNKDSSLHSQADWSSETFSSSVLLEAVKKCQQLFPSHSGGFIHTKKRMTTKEKAGTKRKTTEERRPFEVNIPDGLNVGDTFVTSIQDGDKIKKVRLTVPEGASHTLRFHL